MGENAADRQGDDAALNEVGAIDAGSPDHPIVMAVVNGTEQFAALRASDRSKAHQLIDARIADRATQERFGEPPENSDAAAQLRGTATRAATPGRRQLHGGGSGA